MTPIACDLNAIPAQARGLHAALAQRLFSSSEALEELDNGFRFLLPLALWNDLAQWVALERLCCPFFDFTLLLRHDDQLWLSLTGAEGVKALIQSELHGTA